MTTTASWVIVDRATGRPVMETFERRTADAVNLVKYEVLSTLEWLQRFNAPLRASRVEG